MTPRSTLHGCAWVLVCLTLAGRVWAGETRAPDFDRSIGPLLARRCLDCHSGSDPKGKLDLSRDASARRGGEGGPAIVPGDLNASLLWERVAADEMPPRQPLSEADKSALRDWIRGGAGWGTDPIDPYQATTDRHAGRDWWSLQPVRRPELPRVRRADWPRTPIDVFVLERLEHARLAPAPEADRRTLIRRLSFDLTGLPPTPEEVEAFEADPAPDAYERVVDRLLASPQYGVRWARRWLDLARYGESNGFEFDEFRPSAWRYRDWVVNAFNADLPYDAFARLQLAGDVLAPDDPNSVEATGFLVAGSFDTVGQNQQSAAMKAVVRQDEMEDIVGNVGQTLLGMTWNCARCHDHKFDPIPQRDYYRIVAALAGVRHGERDLSGIDPEWNAAQHRLDALKDRLAALEEPVRRVLRAERGQQDESAPEPVACWNFNEGPEDRCGGPTVALHGGATLTPEGLRLNGTTAYAVAGPTSRTLRAKTLEAWVKLDRLDQGGGGVIGVQAPDGAAFDALVYAEREPRRWMAGSENFARYRSFEASPEDEAAGRFVCVAIAYDEDGTVRCYRDGKPWGRPYQCAGPRAYAAGEAVIVFGLRHAPAGGNKMLAGTIQRARVYDRALGPEEVARSAQSADAPITSAEIDARLAPAARAEREMLQRTIEAARAQLAARERKAYTVVPRPPEPTRLLVRGNPAQPADIVAPGGMSALRAWPGEFGLPADAPESERRARLAAWITANENPLFARVMVNRLWQAHFGTGLVETPSDFGFQGGRPSHPELLDWLASEFRDGGWSIKRMQRLIVTSAAYRQSARRDAEAERQDAGNRLLWRKSPLRLEAEMLRDAMLRVSGELAEDLGGPSFRDHEAIKAPGTAAMLYQPIDPGAPGLNRRTLYRAWARGGRSALLDGFDCPDPSTTAPRRNVTTTPLQALALLNNALTIHLADRFAAHLAREAGPDADEQVRLAYRLALGRLPSAEEAGRAVAAVQAHGAATLARALFNSNEFLYVD